MKKRDIKVVKRDAKSEVPDPPDPVLPKKKSAADEERELVDSVKGWITEHAKSKVKRPEIVRNEGKKGSF